MLGNRLKARGKFPAVDVLSSISRLMPNVASRAHLECAEKLRELIAHYEEHRDLVQVGAYRKGSDPLLDRAMEKIEAIETLLYHGAESRKFEDTMEALRRLAEDGLGGSKMPHAMADK